MNRLMLAGGQDCYQVQNSLMLDSVANQYLTRTPSAGDRTKWTLSCWVKRSQTPGKHYVFSAENNSQNYTTIAFAGADLNTAGDYLFVSHCVSNVARGLLKTQAVFRDPASWYHLVVVWDSSNATASERMRLYNNGNRITSFQTNTMPAQGEQSWVNNSTFAAA